MQIYKSRNKEDFLQDIVEFVSDNYSDDFSKLKIILPSALLCGQLQKIFIKNYKITFLPNIIPITGLKAESEEVFHIPSERVEHISKLEEKITLAETINSYEILGYNLNQSLSLAPSLANLFFEFETNNISLEDLKNIPILDQAEHWSNIYSFLFYAFTNWKKKLNELHKISRAEYQKLVFEAELTRLQNNNSKHLLFAGIVGDNLISNNFIKDALKLPNVKLILPPFRHQEKQEFSEIDALYKIDQLVKLLGLNSSEIPFFTKNINKTNYSIIDNLISKNSVNNLEQNIRYVEFENIFHEAEYIAIECSKRQDQKIAIIAHNIQSKEQYCRFLDKYNTIYNDLWGNDLLKDNAVSFIFIISDYICSEFDIKKLFSILSHPFINSDESQKIKNIIRKYNRLASTENDVKDIVDEHGDDEEKNYYQKISNILGNKLSGTKFSDIFVNIIKIVEELVDDIWSKCPSISSLLFEINQINWNLNLQDIGLFPEVLKQLCQGGRIINTKPDANILVCRPHEVIFANFDLIIITNLNEDIYPMADQTNPWINGQMEKKLGLEKNLTNLGSTIYDFYLNLQNKNILLTRAKKPEGSQQFLPSSFILRLMHILGDKLNQTSAIISQDIPPPKLEELKTYAKSDKFPKQISATDIETLVRAPYNFYAKKILNLKPIEEIDERPNLAEFGNFFHEVAEEYTKNFDKNNLNLEEKFLEIGRTILNKSKIPKNSKKAWNIKLAAIAPEFISFDNDMRKNSAHIYSEIQGKLPLNIDGEIITITAIADRIDIDKNNNATILDYKTGVAPSKKDVLSGLSPQLLIEAIILSEGGFGISSNNINNLCYVKINSSKPYITISEISISKADIAEHKEHLKELLSHYLQNLNFAIEPNLMKYDNYTHLARRPYMTDF